MEVGRFEFNERPRRPIFPRFSYPVELRVSAQLCFNCTAIINYSPPLPLPATQVFVSLLEGE